MGRNAVALQADLLDEDATQALLPRAAEALGRPVAVLVNNASIFEYDNIETATREQLGPAHRLEPARAVRPDASTGRAGARTPSTTTRGEPVAQGLVINMIDQRVRKLTPEFMTYTMAKMGLWALTQTAAQALAPRVRVNAIGPGPDPARRAAVRNALSPASAPRRS